MVTVFHWRAGKLTGETMLSSPLYPRVWYRLKFSNVFIR